MAVFMVQTFGQIDYPSRANHNQSAFIFGELCEMDTVRRGKIAQFCPEWLEKKIGAL